MTNLKTKILETVKQNGIRMIPKWKFVLYSSLGIIGMLFIFLALIFVMSLVLFVLSRYGFLDMPFFGFMQTLHALSAIPVVLLVCTVALLIIIEIISRFYTFSFRRPLMVTLLAITTVATCASYFVSQTSAHEYVRDYIKSHKYEMLSKMYDRPQPPKRTNTMDVLRGEVVLSSATSATLVLFNGDKVFVYATTSYGTTTMPKVLTVGDDVVMVGSFVNDRFEILRIRPAHHGPFGTSSKRQHIDKRMQKMESRFDK